MSKVLVVRIAGQVANKQKDDETLKRLKLGRKFSAVLVDSSDEVRKGMVHSVAHMVTFGEVTDDLLKKLDKRKKGDVYFLHPPVGGFKKSSKVAAPKGILGHNKEITKLVERMA